MKRFVKIALIISAVLLAVGIAIVVVSMLMGGHVSDLWNSRIQVPTFFHSNRRVTAPHNEYSKNNTYSVAADGIDAIQIDWVSGDVTVKIGETDQIVFSETGADLTEKTALRYGVQGSTLAIHYCDDQPFINVALPDKQLTVIVPASLAANLRELSVGTVSADVFIDDPTFRLEKLDVETVSGNLNAVMDFAGIVELDTVSGGLTVNASVNKFKAESVSGNLSINGAVNEFEANSNSGTLSVTGRLNRFETESVSGDVLLDCRDGAPNDLDIETTSGNVTLQLPQDADLILEYETTSGDFDSAIPVSIRDGNYVIGSGRREWRVETVSGDLTVK